MGVARASGAVSFVVALVVGWLVVLGGSAVANPDSDSDGGGCPPGGCVNVYEGEGGTPQESDDEPESNSSDGCCGGHQKDSTEKKDSTTKTREPEHKEQDSDDTPRVLIVPGRPAPPPAPVRRQPAPQPAAPAPGADFIPAGPAPVLEQTATSRGSGALTPAPSGNESGGPATGDADVELAGDSQPVGADLAGGDAPPPWELIVPAALVAAAGAALAFTPSRRPAPTGAGPLGAAGPAGRFAQAGLGGALSAGPPAGDRKAPPDLKQLAWDWGGHLLGAATVAVSLLSAPISGTGVVVGIVVVAVAEIKRQRWPSTPKTANDMIGGNPYQAAQDAANNGIGQQVRDAHGGADVRAELGPDGSTTSTWAGSQQDVHRDTGGATQPMGDVRRDVIR